MKKTLIALAAFAAVSSFAQSTVTLSGTFDPSIAYSKTTMGNQSVVSKSAVRNNSQGTSQITFKGVEDLGGGLKASFLFENDFDTAYDAKGAEGTITSKGVTNFGSSGGEQYLGLEGGFGSVKLGAANTPSLTTQAGRQPFGTKIGGGFNGVLGSSRVRENNSVVYASPVMAGFSAAVGVSLATPTTPTTTATNAKSDLGLFYSEGPVAAGLSYYKQADVNNQTNLFASYTMGTAKVIVGYHTEDKFSAPGVSTNTNGSNIAGTYALTSAATLLGNYAKLSTGSANADKSIVAIGGRYDLSKRTSVYARYVSETNDNVTLATAVSDVKTTLVGIQHNF